MYFWYHAYGLGIYLFLNKTHKLLKLKIILKKAVGTLNVYSELFINSQFVQKQLLWSLSGDQGNQWFIARVSTDYNENFRVIFEGILSIKLI